MCIRDRQYTEQDRQDGMCRITGGSGAIKPVTVIIKDPYQDQCGACNRNRKSKLQPVILHTISGLFPESGSSHSQHEIIQRREYPVSYTHLCMRLHIPCGNAGDGGDTEAYRLLSPCR